MFTARMVDRKLRWEWLKRGRPFPFDILDKIGHKRFAEEHGADAAATLAVVDCEEIRSDARWLRARLPNLPPSFVLKPASGSSGSRGVWFVEPDCDVEVRARVAGDAGDGRIEQLIIAQDAQGAFTLGNQPIAARQKGDGPRHAKAPG